MSTFIKIKVNIRTAIGQQIVQADGFFYRANRTRARVAWQAQISDIGIILAYFKTHFFHTQINALHLIKSHRINIATPGKASPGIRIILRNDYGTYFNTRCPIIATAPTSAKTTRKLK